MFLTDHTDYTLSSLTESLSCGSAAGPSSDTAHEGRGLSATVWLLLV